ncbi:hypothetical protein G3I40_29495 [Streptomyces sp. SID14478]|uniref:hypothetical protein n=1 Tax=Streptomyces sp. SID14478 TaxID=2706073 RepID=UPI0013D969AA|nr:hypothetical protein [Streptomyces sp. SID14478]NEB79322.1 hypothetical protein [Streptomyces sp. SID14478]
MRDRGATTGSGSRQFGGFMDALSSDGTCELDPVTWDAMIDALKANGVPDETLTKVCAQALAAINSTPAAVRAEWLTTGSRPDAGA